jgi:hypothetical protein
MTEYVASNALSQLPASTQFEIYSIFATMNGFLGETVEAYDVHLPGDEFGVDGIAILIQGELVKNKIEAQDKMSSIKNPLIEFIFFQSKTSTSYDYGEISKFFDAIEAFFSGDLANESEHVGDLFEAMEEIYRHGVGRRNPKISAFYIATGNYDEPKRIESLRNNFLKRLEDLNIFDLEGTIINLVGAKQLQQWYRSATTSIDVEIEFSKAVVMPSTPHVEEAYIGYLDASQLIKLYTVKDEAGNVVSINKSVFFDNIRDYDPRSKINIEIKESVKKYGGDDFVFRNNGVTVVSKNIDRTADRFRLEDYQIVNGCQTSNIIFDMLCGDEKNDYSDLKLEETIAVPFRLIGSQDDEFVASIIIGTNKQNPVREEQFWALRPFMKNFEDYAKSVDAEEIIYFERRENQYRGQSVERVRIIQASIMMKALAAAILYQPHRAARDYRGISAEYDQMLFQEDHDVRIYHAACYLYYRLEFLWRNQKIDNKHKTFRFYILCATGLLVANGQPVFNMKRAKIEKVARQIIDLSKDEDALKAIVERTYEVIEKQLGGISKASQEKIRDTIRSETFSSEFREQMLKQRISLIERYTVK